LCLALIFLVMADLVRAESRTQESLTSFLDTEGQTGEETLAQYADWQVAPMGAGDQAAFQQTLLELTNQERTQRGLPPLKLAPELAAAALSHSQDMASHNFFSHTGSDGSTPSARVNRANYLNWMVVAENIAAGFDTPASVLQAWMNSPGHRANLLSTVVNEVGIAYVYDAADTFGPYYHYWTQDFGARFNVYPVIINNEAATTNSSSVNLYIYGAGWATEMMISNNPDFAGATWEAYTSTRVWNLAPGNGLRTVYVRLKNGSGQVLENSDTILASGVPELPTDTPTLPPTDTPTLAPPTHTPTLSPTDTLVPPTDTPVLPPTNTPTSLPAGTATLTPTAGIPTILPTETAVQMPTLTPTQPPQAAVAPSFGVIINDGAASTTSPAVVLRLIAPGNTTKMLISNFANLQDGQWQAYKPTSNWNLLAGSPGLKRVYAVYKLADGTMSPVVFDEITLVSPLERGAHSIFIPAVVKNTQ